MKTLTTLVITMFIFSVNCFGQSQLRDSIVKFRTLTAKISYKRGDEWAKYKEIDSTDNILVVYNAAKQKINIYSKEEHTLSILTSKKVDKSELLRFEFDCIDEDGLRIKANIVYSKINEDIVLAIGYPLYRFAYYMRFE